MNATSFQTHQHPALHRYLMTSAHCGAASSQVDLLTATVNHVICGEAIALLSALPDDCVDLVHTSPPYNIDRPYDNGVTDNAPNEDYFGFLTRAIREIQRVVRPGGSVFWQTGYTQESAVSREIIPIDLNSYEIFRSGTHPFMLWDRIIWRYWGGHAFTKKFTNKHETILWYVKGNVEPTFTVDAVREQAKEYDKRNNFWGRNPGNVWEVDRVAFGSLEQSSHIAVFPEEITERIVRACSGPGHLVLDPFAGSGTVPKVAHSLGRRWMGIDISPAYAAEAAVRVGYQQPSENDTLLSELLKHVGFGDRVGMQSLDTVMERLGAWAATARIQDHKKAFQQDVGKVFDDGSGRNYVKQAIWRKYDDMLAQAPMPSDPVHLADHLLHRSYRLRRRFNGVRRYDSALTLLEAALGRLTEGDIQANILKIIEQEPSSYILAGDTLELTTLQRIIRSPADGTENVFQPEAAQEQPDSYQGRLLG